MQDLINQIQSIKTQIQNIKDIKDQKIILTNLLECIQSHDTVDDDVCAFLHYGKASIEHYIDYSDVTLDKENAEELDELANSLMGDYDSLRNNFYYGYRPDEEEEEKSKADENKE